MKTVVMILVLCGFSCVLSLLLENSNSNPLSYQQQLQRQRQSRSAIGSIGNYYTGALYTSGGGSDGRPGHGAIGSIDNYVVGPGSVSPLGSSSGSGSAPGLVNYYSSADHENPAATRVSDKYLYAGWRLIPNGFSAMDDTATASAAYWKNKAQQWNPQNFPSAGIVNYYD